MLRRLPRYATATEDQTQWKEISTFRNHSKWLREVLIRLCPLPVAFLQLFTNGYFTGTNQLVVHWLFRKKEITQINYEKGH